MWNISQAYDILVFTSKTATSSPIYESIRSILIKTWESRTNIKFIWTQILDSHVIYDIVTDLDRICTDWKGRVINFSYNTNGEVFNSLYHNIITFLHIRIRTRRSPANINSILKLFLFSWIWALDLFFRYKNPKGDQNNYHRQNSTKKGSECLRTNSHFRAVGNTHRGCNAWIPYCAANLPVTKGRTEVPAVPQADIHPIAPLTRWEGITRAVWEITTGYIGPNRMPIMETETPVAIAEGTSQTIIWKLLRGWVIFKYIYYIRVGLTKSRGKNKRRWI